LNDYLKVVYNETERPYTDYPEKLCNYLFNYFKMQKDDIFLEAGCGRGEFIKCFHKLGLNVQGVDISNEVLEYLPDLSITICDIEKKGLPYADESFDIIYSKSLIEHFYYPEVYFQESLRVLKNGGKLISLVPDWEVNYKIYFDDYTHRTPFTKYSLEEIYKIHGFREVEVFKFRQLPIVWRYPYLNNICKLISPFIPLRTKNKFFRWSRELILVGCGYK